MSSFLGLPLAFLALHAPAGLVAVAGFLAGGGNMVFNSLWETTLQKNVPAAALSRVSAYDWFGSLAFQPLGLAIAGPLAAALGTSNALWIAAAGALVVTGLCASTPSVRNLRS